MSYEKTEWKTGDVITAEKLNKIENGIGSGGGSEGNNIVIAHLKLEGMDLRCDMTVAEMEEAIESGKHVVLSKDGALMTNATITAEDHRALFAGIDPDITVEDGYPVFIIDQVVVDEDGAAINDQFTINLSLRA